MGGRHLREGSEIRTLNKGVHYKRICLVKFSFKQGLANRFFLNEHYFHISRPDELQRVCTQSDRTTEPGYKHLQSATLKNTPKDLSRCYITINIP